MRKHIARAETAEKRVAELEAIVKAGEIPLPATAAPGEPPMRAEVLLRAMVRQIGRSRRCGRGRSQTLAWAWVGNLTGHGSRYSAAICRWAGVDPDTGAALIKEG